MSLINKIKKWYKGELVLNSKKDLKNTVVRVSGVHYKQTPTAKYLSIIFNFWINNWRILLPTLVGAFAAIAALFIHFDSK